MRTLVLVCTDCRYADGDDRKTTVTTVVEKRTNVRLSATLTCVASNMRYGG